LDPRVIQLHQTNARNAGALAKASLPERPLKHIKVAMVPLLGN